MLFSESWYINSWIFNGTRMTIGITSTVSTIKKKIQNTLGVQKKKFFLNM